MGLVLNLAFPHFTWKTEAEVIKQSPPTLIAVLGSMALTGLMIGLTVWLGRFIGSQWILASLAVLLAAASGWLYRRLMTKGAELWKTLP